MKDVEEGDCFRNVDDELLKVLKVQSNGYCKVQLIGNWTYTQPRMVSIGALNKKWTKVPKIKSILLYEDIKI